MTLTRRGFLGALLIACVPRPPMPLTIESAFSGRLDPRYARLGVTLYQREIQRQRFEAAMWKSLGVER